MQKSLFAKKILLAIFLGGMLTGNCAVYAETNASTSWFTLPTLPACKDIFTADNGIKLAALTFLAAAFRFYMKEPCNEPARTSWSELWDKFVATLSNPSDLPANAKGLALTLWYALDDLVIGRAYESSSMKADLESDGKIYWREKQGGKPQGFGGYLQGYMKPFSKASLVAYTLYLLFSAKDQAEAKDAFKRLDGKASYETNFELMGKLGVVALIASMLK